MWCEFYYFCVEKCMCRCVEKCVAMAFSSGLDIRDVCCSFTRRVTRRQGEKDSQMR